MRFGFFLGVLATTVASREPCEDAMAEYSTGYTVGIGSLHYNHGEAVTGQR
jgi:hypothetical protein